MQSDNQSTHETESAVPVQDTWLEECSSHQKRVPEAPHLINVSAAIARHIEGAKTARSGILLGESRSTGSEGIYMKVLLESDTAFSHYNSVQLVKMETPGISRSREMS